jgi:hypothetical protein
MDVAKARELAFMADEAASNLITNNTVTAEVAYARLTLNRVSYALTRWADDHDLEARSEGTRLVK